MRHVQYKLAAFLLVMSSVAYAEDQPATGANPETASERSQASARAVLDRAVDAMGGAGALRAIDSVRLRLEGNTWPRLQMTTSTPPYESGTLQETLVLDLKNSRMLLEQRGAGQGFEN